MAEGLEAENYASEREETEKYLMEFWTRLEATLVYYRKKIEFLREDGLFAEICSGLETRYEETLSEARKLTEALEKTLQSENQHKSPALRERVLQDMEAILRPTARIDSSGSA